MLLASSVHASVLELPQRRIRQCSLLGSLSARSAWQPVQILSHRRYQLTGRVAFKIKYTLLSSRVPPECVCVFTGTVAKTEAACKSHTEKRDDVYQESIDVQQLLFVPKLAAALPPYWGRITQLQVWPRTENMTKCEWVGLKKARLFLVNFLSLRFCVSSCFPVFATFCC